MMFFFFDVVWTRQMKLKVCFTRKKMTYIQSVLFVCLQICCTSLKVIVVFVKPSGTEEVGHEDMQPPGKCITLHSLNVFIQIHLNITQALSPHKNITGCQL